MKTEPLSTQQKDPRDRSLTGRISNIPVRSWTAQLEALIVDPNGYDEINQEEQDNGLLATGCTDVQLLDPFENQSVALWNNACLGNCKYKPTRLDSP